MANLKNITELPLAESADGLNLIVNDNGSAKQIAASAVGAQADFAVTDETSPAFIKNKPVVIQSDWNQNDETASDYIKNKPFEECIISNILVEAEASYGGILPSAKFIFGEEYVIEFDGVRYALPMKQQFNSSTGSEYYIGFNLSDYKNNVPSKGDSSIPFLLSWSHYGESIIGEELTSSLRLYADDTSRTHTIKIIEEKVEVKTLDPKYLPDSVQPDWNQNDPNASDYVKNRPFYEDSYATAILFDRDITLEWDGMEQGRGYYYQFPSELSFVSGTTYTVKCNDKSASIVCSYELLRFDPDNTPFGEGTQGMISNISINVDYPITTSFHLWIGVIDTTLKTLDPKYLPDLVVNRNPYVIDSEAYTYGDDALAAILEGRQILVKVPNKNGNTLYGNFMPVLQYQLPDINNNYLSLFYLKDGIAENIMTAMQTGSFDGVYGTIEMMLSKTYAECPLKASPIK